MRGKRAGKARVMGKMLKWVEGRRGAGLGLVYSSSCITKEE